MTEFILHPRLQEDCHFLADLELSRLLLMDDANYPWCILVPRVADAREIHELTAIRQSQLLTESSRLARTMLEVFNGEKMNIAALGNMVPQLHVHHIVRKQSDHAWPKPVWGQVAATPYQAKAIADIRGTLLPALHAAGEKFQI